jgi:hypothetical protein
VLACRELKEISLKAALCSRIFNKKRKLTAAVAAQPVEKAAEEELT